MLWEIKASIWEKDINPEGLPMDGAFHANIPQVLKQISNIQALWQGSKSCPCLSHEIYPA